MSQTEDKPPEPKAPQRTSAPVNSPNNEDKVANEEKPAAKHADGAGVGKESKAEAKGELKGGAQAQQKQEPAAEERPSEELEGQGIVPENPSEVCVPDQSKKAVGATGVSGGGGAALRAGLRSSRPKPKMQASVTVSVDGVEKADGGVTMFVVTVSMVANDQAGIDIDDSWTVLRRYSEFDAFYQQVVHEIRDIKFPGKSLMPDTEDRRCKLDTFLAKMVGQSSMSSSTQKKLAKFLGIYEHGITRSSLLWPIPGSKHK